MPTYAWVPRFEKDWAALSPDEKAAFRLAVSNLVADLERGPPYRKGLRIKGVQGAKGVYEMTWATDGRATFEFGDEQRPGEQHVIWRRVGTHAIFSKP